jgi:K+-sensing histidine kinase KdpD
LDELSWRFSGNSKLKRIILQVENPNPKTMPQVDREKVYAMLFNLIENTFKFNKKGRIVAGYPTEPNRIVFFVKDS